MFLILTTASLFISDSTQIVDQIKIRKKGLNISLEKLSLIKIQICF